MKLRSRLIVLLFVDSKSNCEVVLSVKLWLTCGCPWPDLSGGHFRSTKLVKSSKCCDRNQCCATLHHIPQYVASYRIYYSRMQQASNEFVNVLPPETSVYHHSEVELSSLSLGCRCANLSHGNWPLLMNRNFKKKDYLLSYVTYMKIALRNLNVSAIFYVMKPHCSFYASEFS